MLHVVPPDSEGAHSSNTGFSHKQTEQTEESLLFPLVQQNIQVMRKKKWKTGDLVLQFFG